MAAERNNLSIEVDVFDKNDYVGGRSTTVQPYDDGSLEAIELGGSLFVRANKLLWRASDDYGLERSRIENEGIKMGIWDGRQFVLTVGGRNFLGGWWSNLKVWWRYGHRSFLRTQAAVDALVSRIATLYSPGVPVFENMSSLADELGWFEVVGQTSLEYLRSKQVNDRWSYEVVEAVTRLNYGQNVDQIHAIEGLVSLADIEVSTVRGGMRRIFERFAQDSQATFFLNTTIATISRALFWPGWPDDSELGWNLYKAYDGIPTRYDAVILAVPFHQSGINIQHVRTVPPQPYAHLHVTLLTTTSPSPNPVYFNRRPGSKLPEMIFTTHDGARRGGVEPEFNSLSYLQTRELGPWTNPQGQTEWVVKIFSKKRLSDGWLRTMFNDQVGWVSRKEWDAYPIFDPTTEFPPIELGRGLYYVNAFEPLLSTMETEVLAARNVVELFLKDYHNLTLCGAERSIANTVADDKFVYGWDCL